MRPTETIGGLLLVGVLLGGLLSGCTREMSTDFCASHGAGHRQHREQQAQLQIDYTESGVVDVQLSLPRPLSQLQVERPEAILALPAQCAVGELTREAAREEWARNEATTLRFQAQCGEVKPDSLSVPLLQDNVELQEVEVSMTTPAVRKHFVVHQDCERALFNLAVGPAYD